MATPLRQFAFGVAVSAMLACTAGAGLAQEPTGPALRVVVCDGVGADPAVLAGARAVVSRVYRKAGVHIAWSDHAVADSEAASGRAAVSAQNRIVYVRLIRQSQRPRGLSAVDAVGFATTGGRMASVVYGQVVELARIEHHAASQLVGYVMAHEIGHLLLGSRPHAATGLMRSTLDTSLSGQGLLWFNADEAVALRARLVAVDSVTTQR